MTDIAAAIGIEQIKKNPDVLELVRAKYHQTLSDEFKVKSIIANMFSGYSRDLQLIKEPIIRSL
jgi:argininosuccinate lyase